MTAPQEPSVIKFFCPCGQRVSVPASLAGKSGTCPKCNAALKVPPASQGLQPPAARGPATSRTPTRPLQTDPAPAETCSRETEEMPVAAIPFVCPRCGHQGQVSPSFDGKAARCTCGNLVQVPSRPAEGLASGVPSVPRSGLDRRNGPERRRMQVPIAHDERRRGTERRTDIDRRGAQRASPCMGRASEPDRRDGVHRQTNPLSMPIRRGAGHPRVIVLGILMLCVLAGVTWVVYRNSGQRRKGTSDSPAQPASRPDSRSEIQTAEWTPHASPQVPVTVLEVSLGVERPASAHMDSFVVVRVIDSLREPPPNPREVSDLYDRLRTAGAESLKTSESARLAATQLRRHPNGAGGEVAQWISAVMHLAAVRGCAQGKVVEDRLAYPADYATTLDETAEALANQARTFSAAAEALDCLAQARTPMEERLSQWVEWYAPIARYEHVEMKEMQKLFEECRDLFERVVGGMPRARTTASPDEGPESTTKAGEFAMLPGSVERVSIPPGRYLVQALVHLGEAQWTTRRSMGISWGVTAPEVCYHWLVSTQVREGESARVTLDASNALEVWRFK